MKTAIGTKVIRFEPMSKEEFMFRSHNLEHGFEDNRDVSVDIPVAEQFTPGNHVQYNNPDGSVYDSWSPKDVFEAAYQDIANNLTFENMLFLMKKFPGQKYAREGFKDYSPLIEYIYFEYIYLKRWRSDIEDGYIFVKFADKAAEKALSSFDEIPIDDILANDWYEVK